MKKEKIQSALLEIGVEELPARFIEPALERLEANAKKMLDDKGLEYASLQVWGSPRRLTILIKDLPPKAKDRTDVMIGPPPAAAKDGAGQWTQAALGFAKSQKCPVEALKREQTSKGERYVVKKEVKGAKTDLILPDLFTYLIHNFDFPKTMVWEPSRFRFARPIRWFVALYGKKVVRFTVAGVRSDRFTIGLLAMGGQRLAIPMPEKYKGLLQGRCILVDPADRRKKIEEQLDIMAKKVKGRAIAPADHISEVVHLCEYPVSLLGRIDEAFLKLPREVLVSVLRKHQKFFPLENSKGDLLPHFIGVRNGPSESLETVREGYERVTRARLSDANFFFEADSKVPLSDLVEKLKEVGFHEKLGSIYDKTTRIRALTAVLGKEVGVENPVLEKADRAAFLSKADLLTHMVGELPELQGATGRFYGLVQEPAIVAHAIEEHYWPLTAQGRLPTTDVGSIVALADKMDTLAADFSIGLIPSGSADPYGLRRCAIGVIRILLERKWNISIDALVDLAIKNLGSVVTGDPMNLKSSLLEFLRQRISAYFENLGYRTDEVETVLAGPQENLHKKSEKLKALRTIRERPEFASLTAAIKRARNILIQAEEKGFLKDLVGGSSVDLSDPSEKALVEAVLKIKPQIEKDLIANLYPEVLVGLSSLKEPIDKFFEGVMVMVDEAALRQKRLTLLKEVKNLFDGFADFSRLQGASAEVERR